MVYMQVHVSVHALYFQVPSWWLYERKPNPKGRFSGKQGTQEIYREENPPGKEIKEIKENPHHLLVTVLITLYLM